jgi:hypothetical protein
MAAVLTIPARFNGPPASGHGGYTCGVVAAAAEGRVAVSLRRPPPLETPLAVTPGEDGGIAVRAGDQVVAFASPAEVDVTPPPMPEPAPAPSGGFTFGELREHPFPTCFGCGPARAPDDGLRIFATPVPGSPGTVAASWTPHESLGDDGEVAPEFVWAALDCPTGHACTVATPVVLARLAVRQLAPVRTGARHVVAAWRESRDGRKLHAAGCLYDADGTPVAVSRALWIELRDPETMGARR